MLKRGRASGMQRMGDTEIERDRKPEREARRATDERKREREWNGRRQAGWGKRPKLPWRPATNCRRPRLRAARYSRPSVRAGDRRGGTRGAPEHTAGPEFSARCVRALDTRSFVPRSPAHERRAGMSDGMRTIGRISLLREQRRNSPRYRGRYSSCGYNGCVCASSPGGRKLSGG